MKDLFYFGLLLLTSLMAWPSQGQVRAFPGAEGAGAGALGGRGGKVIAVTNLNDSGPGSFRAAVTAKGPRLVVFRVGGTIVLKNSLLVTNPYLTIAGQTAPGGGIQISGKGGSPQPMFIFTHDVVIRYLRIRVGELENKKLWSDVLRIGGGSYNVMVDHCSLAWGNKRIISCYAQDQQGRNKPFYNITFSNNIIAESITYQNGQSTGLALGGNDSESIGQIKGISIFRNFFANNNNRNPEIGAKTAEVVNNLIYNWGWYAAAIHAGTSIDLIGNDFVPGPEDQGRSVFLYSPNPNNKGPNGNPSIYMHDNRAPGIDPRQDNWAVLGEMTARDGLGWPGNPPRRTPIPLPYKRLARRQTSPYPITTMPVEKVAEAIIDKVGASLRLAPDGRWVGVRDAADRRVVGHFKNKTGGIIRSEQSVGGFPYIAPGTPYPDQDNDGMSDTWEDQHGFDKNNPQDGNLDADADGYTNVEEFINGTNPGGTPLKNGLRYAFYNNRDLGAPPAATGIDPNVDFDWGRQAPAPSLPADNFSVRWTGQVMPQYSQEYTFYTRSDDGVRLWVNGQKLVDDWTDHAVKENRGRIRLKAGQKYDIRLEYYENRGEAVCQLLWSSPALKKETIPSARLFAPGAKTARKSPQVANALRIYPNPTADGQVAIAGLAGTSTLAVYDLQGRQVPFAVVQQNHHTKQIHIKAPAGWYVVSVGNNGKPPTKRLIRLM